MGDLRRTAVHEAGHAVIRYMYGRTNFDLVRQFEAVTIEAATEGLEEDPTRHGGLWVDAEALGELETSDVGAWRARTRRRVEHQIMVSVAGVVAEEIYGLLGSEEALPYRTGDGGLIEVAAGYGDVHEAYELANHLAGSDETRASFLDWLGHRVRDFLTDESVAPALEALADALEERGTLIYHEAVEVMDEAAPPEED